MIEVPEPATHAGPTWKQIATLAAALAGVGGVSGGVWSKDSTTAQVASAVDPMAHRVERLDGRMRRLEWQVRGGGCARVDEVEQGPPAPAAALPRLRPVR
jgi:outer membrane murein-binding lipoprotein Lpp